MVDVEATASLSPIPLREGDEDAELSSSEEESSLLEEEESLEEESLPLDEESLDDDPELDELPSPATTPLSLSSFTGILNTVEHSKTICSVTRILG